MKWLDRLFGGPTDMAALPPGKIAPEFSLPAASVSGETISLQSTLRQGPVLLAFFKVSCPTCQYTFPYLDRLHKAHGQTKVTILGISQNNQRETADFLKEYGVTFPALLDDLSGYAVSNAYGLTNVPTLFLIGQDGKIQITSVGWVKKEIEDINRELATAERVLPPAIFNPAEDVRDFRAG